MMEGSPAQAGPRYRSAIIIIHWAMFLLIAAVYATIELREIFPRGSDPRETMKAWHFMLGLSVFALVLLRVLVRFASSTPAIMPRPPKWQHIVAGMGHGALYAFMIAMPLAGWIILSAEGEAISFFGLSLPSLVAEDRSLAERVEDLHELGGKIGYFLIGLHAAAALIHHYLLRDNTLSRMMPGRN